MSQENVEETAHPASYLRLEKQIGDTWVTTGWAPNVDAAGKHAGAVGGSVRATDQYGEEIATFAETFDVTDNVKVAREVVALDSKTCYGSAVDLQG